jgi:serine O-acetyltransferase
MRAIGVNGTSADHEPSTSTLAALRGTDERTAAAACSRASLWSDIAWLAVETAAREPVLRDVIADTRLMDAVPARIVGAVLARRLESGDRAEGAALQTLFVDSLEEEPAILSALETDLLAVASHDPACRSPLHALLLLKGLHALQTHRIAHSLWQRERFDIALWLSSLASTALGVDIHPAVPIGKGVILDHATGIVIGETAVVEDGVTIFQGVTLGATGTPRGDRHPKVRQGALLGAGAKVLGNIEVGRGSKVGAGSVVLRPVPARCTVAGVPAKVVRTPIDDALDLAEPFRTAA